MRCLSLLLISLLSLSQLATSAPRPGTTINIEISIDDKPSQYHRSSSSVTHGRLRPQQSLGGMKLSCSANHPHVSGLGKPGDKLVLCPSLCGCNKLGQVSCTPTEKYSQYMVELLCTGAAKCQCVQDDGTTSIEGVPTTAGVTCPAKEPFEVECGASFTSTKDCPKLCGCGKDGKLECKHSEDCDQEAVLFMCGAEVAGCHC